MSAIPGLCRSPINAKGGDAAISPVTLHSPSDKFPSSFDDSQLVSSLEGASHPPTVWLSCSNIFSARTEHELESVENRYEEPNCEVENQT